LGLKFLAGEAKTEGGIDFFSKPQKSPPKTGANFALKRRKT
jgi:hypothetical protein